MFSAQYAILLYLFFRRWNQAFIESAEQLSKCAVATFYIIFGIWLLIAIYEIVIFTTWEQMMKGEDISLAGLNVIFIFMLMLVCTLSFLYQLIAVNRKISEQVASRMIPVITRIAVLGFTAIISFIFSFTAIFVGCFRHILAVNPVHYSAFLGFVLTLDTLVNFGSVLLTLAHFEKYYLMVFGCCDRRCKSICRRFAIQKDNLQFVVADSRLRKCTNQTLEMPQTNPEMVPAGTQSNSLEIQHEI